MSTEERPVDPRRLLTRAAIALVVIADGALLVSDARGALSNSDTYFHLRFGEEFLHGWSITHPGQPNAASSADWVPTQWLGQVWWAFSYDHGGVHALAVLAALLLGGLIATVYATTRSLAGPTAAVLVTSLTFIGSNDWLGVRPQLISYVFTALTVLAWQRARSRATTPWALIPLTWLWAMCHGMWILGVVIGVAAAVALAIEQAGRGLALRRSAVSLASLAAAAATPVGPRLLAAVVEVNGRGSHFAEWAPTPLLHGWGLPGAAAVAVVAFGLMARGRAAPYPLVMLGLATLFLAYSGRTVMAGHLVIAPLLAAELTALGARWGAEPDRRDRPASPRLLRAGLVVLVASIALGAIGAVDPRPGLVERISPFAARLETIPPGSVLLSGRADGALLLWAYPRLEVPVHGYGDVFTDPELDAYDGLGTLAPGWDRTVTRLGARYALLDPTDPLAYALTERGWRAVQSTADLELLTR